MDATLICICNSFCAYVSAFPAIVGSMECNTDLALGDSLSTHLSQISRSGSGESVSGG